MQVTSTDHFPLATPDLQKTFFLEYDQGKITERDDLVLALQARRSCPRTAPRVLIWDFANEAEGWEAWNDISDWRVKEGALTFKSKGNDPFMASPVLNIPVREFGSLQIQLAVRAVQPTTQGEVYWQTTNMDDFSPDLKQGFQITADGDWHTYTLALPPGLATAGASPIARLRFDPAEAAADIRLESVQIECK